MQTQRTILWVIFSMSLLFLWDGWQRHNGQPSLLGGMSGTTTAPVIAPDQVGKNGAAPSAATPPPAGTTPTAAAVPGNAPIAAGVVPAAVGKLTRIQSDVLALEVDSVGGVIRKAELLTHKNTSDKKQNITLLESKPGNLFIAETGLIGAANQTFINQSTPFTVLEGVRDLAGGEQVQIKLAAENGGLKVVKTITLNKSSYEVLVSHDVTNISQDSLTPQLYLQLTRDGGSPPVDSQFMPTFFTGMVVYTEKSKFQKIDFAEIEKNKTTYEKQSSDGWLGVIQHYFVTAWIPADKVSRDYSVRKVTTNQYAISATQPMAPLAAGASVKTESRLFIGPQDQRILSKIAPGLEYSVDYGIWTVIAQPLYWLLGKCYDLVKNWGWAIILLTAVVKLAFFPLQNFAYKSMARMKTVAPKMKVLQEKFGSDRVKLNQAMMEMYKTEKINPMGSCLPVLLQIPVFMSLYTVLLSSVEVRDAPWIGWIRDLAAPDPFYILPVVLAATSYIQIKMSPPPPDPLQAKMMTIMPLMFSVMFFFFPAGLVLYWLANNIFSIAQQWYINRSIEKAAAKAA
jgi:YidC/Oxa1 family membrane protein insertase